jgi:hypothetical protein
MIHRTFQQMRTGGDWRARRDQFAEALEVSSKSMSKMSQFEQETVSQELLSWKDNEGRRVLGEAMEYYHSTLDHFRDKQSRVERERTREIARWDAGKLAPEMQVFSMRVENAVYSHNPGLELEEVYAEAKQSGDIYKLRAAADALKRVEKQSANLPIEVRTHLNRTARTAQQDLAEIRTTPELATALTEAEQAFNQAMQARDELQKTDRICSMQSPDFNYRPSSVEVLRALSRVQDNGQGGAVITARNDRTD